MKYKDWLDVWFANYGNQFFDISKCIRSRNNDTDTAKPLVLWQKLRNEQCSRKY